MISRDEFLLAAAKFIVRRPADADPEVRDAARAIVLTAGEEARLAAVDKIRNLVLGDLSRTAALAAYNEICSLIRETPAK